MSLGCGDRGSAISGPVLSACSRSRGDWTDRGDWSWRHDLEGRAACGSRILKTASQEKVFEIMAPVGTVAFAKAELKQWMKPVDIVVPKALRESGHTAKVYREPYGVTLVIGPFNGPLTLLFDPAVQVL